MVRQRTAYAAAVLVIAAAVLLYLLALHLQHGSAYQQAPVHGPEGNFPIGRISIGNSSYNVYIAANAALQEQGYMNSSSIGSCGGLGNCAGMLFLFRNYSTECFWMKNTIMALKQSWIANGTVNYTYIGTPYSTAIICSPGNMVLETLPNFSINYGNKVAYR